MADTVTVKQLSDTRRHCVYEFTNRSDGTGESAVKKVDIADLIGTSGATTGDDRPTSLSIIRADYETSFSSVTLLWDRQPTDEVALVMEGEGSVDFTEIGGKHDPKRGQDGTGNILLTTVGTTSGMAYSIRVKFKKKYS